MNRMNVITEKIKSFEDRIFYFPLSGKEIIELEVELKITFPDEFFSYLKYFGLLQDLIPNMLMTKSEYLFERDFINRVVQEQPNTYFAFSNDGYGNLLALKGKEASDEYVYKIAHETGRINKTKYTFPDFTDKWVNRAIKGCNQRKKNVDKCWSVQFCFEVQDESFLCDLINEQFDHSLDDEWKYEDISPAGVTSYVKGFSIGGEKLVLQKYEYQGWETNHYSFNYSESVIILKKGQSIIEKMNKLFNSSSLGFKLVNYGILAL